MKPISSAAIPSTSVRPSASIPSAGIQPTPRPTRYSSSPSEPPPPGEPYGPPPPGPPPTRPYRDAASGLSSPPPNGSGPGTPPGPPGVARRYEASVPAHYSRETHPAISSWLALATYLLGLSHHRSLTELSIASSRVTNGSPARHDPARQRDPLFPPLNCAKPSE